MPDTPTRLRGRNVAPEVEAEAEALGPRDLWAERRERELREREREHGSFLSTLWMHRIFFLLQSNIDAHERFRILKEIDRSALLASELDLNALDENQLSFKLSSMHPNIPPLLELASIKNWQDIESKSEIDRNRSISLKLSELETDDEFEYTLVKLFGFSASEAKEKLSAAREAILKLKNSAEQASATDEAAGDPRFAHIEKYVDRPKGEDAIGFYQRAWSAAPQPYYREDVAEHDPLLVAAVVERCKTLNRGVPKGGARHKADDILPPHRPVEKKIASRREAGRKRQAAYMAKIKGPTP